MSIYIYKYSLYNIEAFVMLKYIYFRIKCKINSLLPNLKVAEMFDVKVA